MEIERRVLKSGAVRWRVRWRQGGRHRSQTFDRKGDAVMFSAELRRRQQLGTLTEMDMGRLTLAEYVVGTWCEAYASQLSPKTWMHYRQLLNKHILPSLGSLHGPTRPAPFRAEVSTGKASCAWTASVSSSLRSVSNSLASVAGFSSSQTAPRYRKQQVEMGNAKLCHELRHELGN